MLQMQYTIIKLHKNTDGNGTHLSIHAIRSSEHSNLMCPIGIMILIKMQVVLLMLASQLID